MSRHRVLVVTAVLGGGTGNHVLSMMGHWDRSRWDPLILSEQEPAPRVETDVPVRRFPKPRWFERSLLRQMSCYRHLVDRVTRWSPDVVHTYFFWPIVLGRILKMRGHIECLVENREDQGFSWRDRDYRVLRLTRSAPDRVVCVSHAVREVVLERERLDPERVVVVHNGLEVDDRRVGGGDPDAGARDARRELGFDGSHLLVGTVANLNRAVKGVEYLLEAVPLIRDRVPEARFLILGRGRHEAELRRKARELGVERYVVFAGYRIDIDRFYRCMDVSVLTSLTEGLSMTILESMAHGLPVVVTYVGGNPEVVVEAETGFLVPPKDPERFSDRVVRLLRNPELRERFGRAARRRVEEEFDLTRAATRYLQIYEEVLASSA